MTNQAVLETLTSEQRRTLVLAYKYELERKRHGQGRYQLFSDFSPEITKHSIFKTFDTTRKWLEAKHWKVSWKFSNWQGYVEFVFDFLTPQIPQPGQLRNELLFRKYMEQPAKSNNAVKDRNDEQLRQIYSKVVPAEYLEFCLGSFMNREVATA